jgi:hypothetical protein
LFKGVKKQSFKSNAKDVKKLSFEKQYGAKVIERSKRKKRGRKYERQICVYIGKGLLVW